ncbi:YCII-related domain protein [Aspergillus parasiticus SU-1]|uniref:YCII-related domain protein n=1 Tax=Aspergillus parasiticus (strain ATCC 56775 / NRRL 5862 / SRRC 143 / SU-1) TaxID=1403190 RepID=A0A0F0IJR9_ASPPU|nr:YCII-related domain protein [Aspergillus parasiticus SU-1]
MSAKKEFICLVPDKPGSLQKRLEVRKCVVLRSTPPWNSQNNPLTLKFHSQHLEGVKPFVQNGSIVCGGGTLESHPAPGETPPFNGSALIVVAENEAEVRELISNDIYTRSGVWDVEKAQIIPFMCAVRVGDKALP